MSSTRRKWLTPIILISIALVLAVLMTQSRPDNSKVEMEVRKLSVDVAEVVLQDIRIPVQAQGTVSPHRETDIVAEVGGKVIEVSPSFYTGGYVAKGDVLLRIEDIEHETNLNRAQAAVASAESALAQEQGRADVAAQEFVKFPNKHRTDSARDLYLRMPQLKQAKAQLLSAQADLRKAQYDLDRTVIQAPYDSIIKAKQSDLGLYLSPGTPVASLFAVDFAEVRLAIPQTKLAYLELPAVDDYADETPANVDLYTNVGGELQQWQAKLHRTEGVYDERSRVLFTVARVDDPYLLNAEPISTLEAAAKAKQAAKSIPLRMGTFVSAVIQGRLIEDLVVLPRNVLRAGGYLWVVDQQMKLRNRKVSTLRTQGNNIYVTGGLQNGDQVCLTPIGSVVAGSTVNVTSSTPTDKLSGKAQIETLPVDDQQPTETAPTNPEVNTGSTL